MVERSFLFETTNLSSLSSSSLTSSSSSSSLSSLSSPNNPFSPRDPKKINQSFPDLSKSINLITDLLTNLFNTFVDYQIYDSIILQAFNQIMYYISSSLFNLVMKRKDYYCNTQVGFRLKMGISFLESWVIQTNLRYNNYHHSNSNINILDDCLFVFSLLIFF